MGPVTCVLLKLFQSVDTLTARKFYYYVIKRYQIVEKFLILNVIISQLNRSTFNESKTWYV